MPDFIRKLESSFRKKKKTQKTKMEVKSAEQTKEKNELDKSTRKGKGTPVKTPKKTSKLDLSKCERRKEEAPKPEPWSGDEAAKKMVTSGIFNADSIQTKFKELSPGKPVTDGSSRFKKNSAKSRVPDLPIPDDKLVKLQHAPENFIAAAKVTVPEFNRTMILSQVPDVTVPANIEDFWRMIFHEEVVSVVIALMPLEGSVTLQQLFPVASGSFDSHGKMFLNNKKVESSVGVTSYTLEILPDGCSNSINTTVYHVQNWKQKKGLDNVAELVTMLEKIVKVNENTVFMSLNGVGRAGTMLALFSAMLQIGKGKEVKMNEVVEKLRQERCGVVESLEQFVTLHKGLAVWFKKKSLDEEVLKKAGEYAAN